MTNTDPQPAGPLTTPTEPRVAEWVHADTDTTCPTCATPIRAGDDVAVLDTAPPSTCCTDCTDTN